jgi:hypothetical protein
VFILALLLAFFELFVFLDLLVMPLLEAEPARLYASLEAFPPHHW